uniref:Uncharacterized protein n=1 Tax=Rhodnius prolixus TaxID=13249 RepID=T1H836_RHOPR
MLALLQEGNILNNIYISSGKRWEELRKPLNKVLTKKMIESNLNMFHEKSIRLCNVLKKYADGGETFNLRNYVTNFTADTLSRKYFSNFGYDLNEIENNNHRLCDRVEGIVETIIKLASNFLHIIYLPFSKFSKNGRCLKEIGKLFWKLCCTVSSFKHKILQARIDTRKKLGENMDDKPTFYCDVLISKAKQYKLSWEDTGKLATDFFIAGFDTSAVIGSYTLLMLAMFPEHQEAVYQEQLEILGENPDIVPQWEQLSKMTYLTKVIKEVMRLYSPPGIFRKITKDIDLGENYKLPEGSTAFIIFYYLHRDPVFWSHPDKFYPDHFLPEECEKRPKGSYFPFSWGPRSCPGSVYAMTSIKVLVSTAIRYYKLYTNLKFHELEYRYSIMLEVNEGYMVKIKPRN